MSFNSRLAKAVKSTVIALNTVVSGTTVGGPSLSLASGDIEGDTLCANVSSALTTNLLTVTTKWQVSQDGTTWVDVQQSNGAALVRIAPAGTGSLVTTAFCQLTQFSPAHPYIRLALVTGGATGAAGDNVTVSYNFRKRSDQ